MIPKEIKNLVNQKLAKIFDQSVEIKKEKPLGGGDINSAYKISTNAGDFFLKYNYADRFPRMFETEARGLKLLAGAGEITVPNVRFYDETDNYAFLVLDYIESSKKVKNYWQVFGKELAMLHKHEGEKFGLDHDNYIGSLHQSNKPKNTWREFFVEERLMKQVELARKSGMLPKNVQKSFESLFLRIDEIFPEEPPHLIHGDLWSGNFMTGNDGKACIIDPAVYYGHREMDLGMSKLFGGFAPEFYDSYHETFPLASGWEDRLDICNLYPLMVHVNLFGGSYLASVESILKRF